MGVMHSTSLSVWGILVLMRAMGPLKRSCPTCMPRAASSQMCFMKVAFMPWSLSHVMLVLGLRRGDMMRPPSSPDGSLAVPASRKPRYSPASRRGAESSQHASAGLGTTITMSLSPGWLAGPVSVLS